MSSHTLLLSYYWVRKNLQEKVLSLQKKYRFPWLLSFFRADWISTPPSETFLLGFCPQIQVNIYTGLVILFLQTTSLNSLSFIPCYRWQNLRWWSICGSTGSGRTGPQTSAFQFQVQCFISNSLPYFSPNKTSLWTTPSFLSHSLCSTAKPSSFCRAPCLF